MFHHCVDNFQGIGSVCGGCYWAGRRVVGLAQPVRKAWVGTTPDNAVEICPICDQHPDDAPDWILV